MLLLLQTHTLHSLDPLAILRASLSEETGLPSGHCMLNLSFPNPSMVREVLPGFFFYLGNLGLIFLLGILHRLQVVSGTVIVHEFPTPLGDSFLTQSHEKELDMLGGQE